MSSSISPFKLNSLSSSKSRQQAESHLSTPLLQALHQHLSSSLFNSTCSDIQIKAFGNTYALHRVFLVQSAFFHSLLNGGFHEAHPSVAKRENVLELHFDDPSITRPAFEYCIASLYGAAPSLTLPTWCSPSPQYPLTEHVKSVHVAPRATAQNKQANADNEGEGVRVGEVGVKSGGAKHPATPRFLLSLLATSLYLGTPSTASTAMTLILSSITPFTVSHYLRFALGNGIVGAREAKARREGGTGAVWDWELDGPAWGLAGLAKSDNERPYRDLRVAGGNTMNDPKEGDGSATPRETYATHDSLIASDERSTSYQMDSQRLYYGTYSDKIGEGCSCWLLRWATEMLRLEEELVKDKSGYANDSYILPMGILPVSNALTADDFPREISSSLPPPRPSLWCHPSLGGIPADYVCSTIASDSFWVREEWDRYDIARRVVALRRAHVYAPLASPSTPRDDSLVGHGNDREDRKETVRDEDGNSSPARMRRDSVFSTSQGTLEDDQDETEYDRLFSEGIYYSHMSFNRLSTISSDVCPHTGLTYAPTNILQSALWAQAELKNVVLSSEAQRDDSNLDTKAHDEDEEDHEQRAARANTRESKEADSDRELGLISSEQDFAKAFSSSRRRARTSRAHTAEGKRPTTLGGVTPVTQSPLQSAGNAVDGLLSKRYFAVPVDDTIRMGENLSTLVGGAQSVVSKKQSTEQAAEEAPCGIASVQDPNTLAINVESKRMSSGAFFGLRNAVESGSELAKRGLQRQNKEAEEDDSVDNLSELYQSLDIAGHQQDVKPREWTGFEPMRVGVEFFNVDRLPEKQRLYSRSFFYAGNVWNLYVQTVRKPKGLQLGIYLHRQNCSDTLPSPSLPSRAYGAMQPSVSQSSFLEDADDTTTMHGVANVTNNVGQQHLPQTPQRQPVWGEGTANRSMGSIFLHAPATNIDALSPQSRTLGTPMRVRDPHPDLPWPLPREYVTVENPNDRREIQTLPPTPASGAAKDNPSTAAATSDDNQQLEVPYLDQRRVLRAYFSIHCPSPMGTSLTKFSSRPDNFSLSQSWGWKSSSLLGSVFLQDGHIGSAQSQTSQTFRCVVTMGVV